MVEDEQICVIAGAGINLINQNDLKCSSLFANVIIISLSI